MRWQRLVRWLARKEIQEAESEWYLKGLRTGRAERPMTCGLTYHHPDDYMYDPGQ